MTFAATGRLPLAVLVLGSITLPAIVLPASPAGAVGNPNGLPSIECQFTEPFIDVAMSVEGLVVTEAGTKAKGWGFQSVLEGQYSFIGAGQRTTLTIKDEPGGDGMSDRDFPLTGLFGSFAGGCIRHPKGWVPRKVTGVAANDVLNLRKTPKASAAQVATARNGQRIFVKPSTTKWKKVSVITYPRGESGPVTIVSGWANGDFITTKPDPAL